MRRAAAFFVLFASALWAAPAHAQLAGGPPYDYQRGLANKETGFIASADAGAYASGPGGVGIRQSRGPGMVRVRADLKLARAGVGSSATLCLRVIDVGSWCGQPVTGGQVSPSSFIQADFSLPSSRTWTFEVYMGASRGSGAGAAVSAAWVERLTVTPV